MYFIVDNDKKEVISKTDDIDDAKKIVERIIAKGINADYLDGNRQGGLRWDSRVGGGWQQLQPFTGAWHPIH